MNNKVKVTGKDKKVLILEHIGEDFFSCPVYRDQNKLLWKDIDLGESKEPNLYSVGDNEFDGDPAFPLRKDVEYIMINKKLKEDVMDKEYIKVNLPLDEQGYKGGNGEGVWVIVDQDVFKQYKSDYCGGKFTGTIANDSLYYPSLQYGSTVVFTMRGKNRPVAIYGDFLDRLTAITKEQKNKLIEKTLEYQESRKE
jgi:Uncharacterized protein conserved in bacteria